MKNNKKCLTFKNPSGKRLGRLSHVYEVFSYKGTVFRRVLKCILVICEELSLSEILLSLTWQKRSEKYVYKLEQGSRSWQFLVTK